MQFLFAGQHVVVQLILISAGKRSKRFINNFGSPLGRLRKLLQPRARVSHQASGNPHFANFGCLSLGDFSNRLFLCFKCQIRDAKRAGDPHRVVQIRKAILTEIGGPLQRKRHRGRWRLRRDRLLC